MTAAYAARESPSLMRSVTTSSSQAQPVRWDDLVGTIDAEDGFRPRDSRVARLAAARILAGRLHRSCFPAQFEGHGIGAYVVGDMLGLQRGGNLRPHSRAGPRIRRDLDRRRRGPCRGSRSLAGSPELKQAARAHRSPCRARHKLTRSRFRPKDVAASWLAYNAQTVRYPTGSPVGRRAPDNRGPRPLIVTPCRHSPPPTRYPAPFTQGRQIRHRGGAPVIEGTVMPFRVADPPVATVR
jgi:hypothetical protein